MLVGPNMLVDRREGTDWNNLIVIKLPHLIVSNNSTRDQSKKKKTQRCYVDTISKLTWVPFILCCTRGNHNAGGGSTLHIKW